MKWQFAFLRLVLFGCKPGIVLKDAAEMCLVIKACMESNISKRAFIAVQKLNCPAEFLMNKQFFCGNTKEALCFPVQLAC